MLKSDINKLIDGTSRLEVLKEPVARPGISEAVGYSGPRNPAAAAGTSEENDTCDETITWPLT